MRNMILIALIILGIAAYMVNAASHIGSNLAKKQVSALRDFDK